jgi:predicted signal transduction protein with EAL and GGDEF domain
VQSTQTAPVDLAQLSEHADLALYASKHAGRGCFTFYHEDLRAEGVLPGVTAAE